MDLAATVEPAKLVWGAEEPVFGTARRRAVSGVFLRAGGLWVREVFGTGPDYCRHWQIKQLRDLPPAHALRAQPNGLVAPEGAPGVPQGLPVGLDGAQAGPDPFPDHLAFQFAKRRQDVQQELRHGVALVGVEALRTVEQTSGRPADGNCPHVRL